MFCRNPAKFIVEKNVQRKNSAKQKFKPVGSLSKFFN